MIRGGSARFLKSRTQVHVERATAHVSFSATLLSFIRPFSAESCPLQVYKNELEGLAIREKALLRQIDSYSGKFGEVETLVQESKAMFAKSKADNDRLAKALRRAEAESGELRRKVLSSEAALLRLLDERRDGEAALKKARARGDKLEALCRTLQEERKGSGAAVGGGAQVGGGTAPETPPGKVSRDRRAHCTRRLCRWLALPAHLHVGVSI